MSTDDKLETFIREYNDGIISLADLERRLLFDQWTTDKRDSKLVSLESCEQMSSVNDNPLDIVIKQELLQSVHNLMPLLKKELKSIDWFILTQVINGTPQTQIAKQLGWKVGRVNKRYERLKKKARIIFKEMRSSSE